MLQRIEEQEREDEKAGFIQTQKTQKGRGVKQKKINLEETLPSPMGRRIMPVIDLATKVKAEKEASSKRRQQVSKDINKGCFYIFYINTSSHPSYVNMYIIVM